MVKKTDKVMRKARVFRGSDARAKLVDVSGKRPKADKWYWEPHDYGGRDL